MTWQFPILTGYHHGNHVGRGGEYLREERNYKHTEYGKNSLREECDYGIGFYKNAGVSAGDSTCDS